MEGKFSAFSFKGYLIQESHIIRQPLPPKDQFKFEIIPSGKHSIKDNSYQLDIIVKVFDENKRFDAKVHCVGFFNFDKANSDKILSNYFFINAPAIVFPYIRAHIAALTALSGMEVINLPTLNLTNLSEDLKKNTVQVAE